MIEKLLKITGPAHVVGGLLLFASGFLPPVQQEIQALLGTSSAQIWSPFFSAVLGPTIASWGVLFGAVVKEFFDAPSSRLWWTMIASVLIWAPLDTALCLHYGVLIGALVNTTVVIVLLGLLIAIKQRIQEYK